MVDLRSASADARRKTVKLSRLVGVPGYRGALRHGVAATIEHEKVPFDRGAKTVIDVGAGRGQFAVFARHNFPDAAIHSFEPLPGSFANAQQVISELDRSELCQVAVGASPGQALMHVTADRDSSSLRAPTSNQRTRFPGTEEVGEEAVQVLTLDELMAPFDGPALLKIDVQGGEMDVLRGAGRVLREVAEVFVECSFLELYRDQPLIDDLVTCLNEKGFRLSGVFSANYGADGECIQADCLFRRRDRALSAAAEAESACERP